MRSEFGRKARVQSKLEKAMSTTTPDKEELKDRLRQLANVEFPAAAKAGKYPIIFNHCFLRVVYDHILQDKWQRVLTNGKPAIHQLTREQLIAAISVGERLVEDVEATRRLNLESLGYRGKGGGSL